jgi:hypothetical protein
MSRNNWSRDERRVLSKLREPGAIQDFLDALPYWPAGGAHSPRTVLAQGRAQCFGGAILAAAALREHGHRPLIVNMRAVNDDDHVLAVFRRDGYWGAVAKSNYTTLRHREPVYRSLRELVMSYFDFYFNSQGEKTLRSYSVTMDLSRYDSLGWCFSADRLWQIEEDIERLRHTSVVPAGLAGRLLPATEQVLAAGMMGANPEGLYTPDSE